LPQATALVRQAAASVADSRLFAAPVVTVESPDALAWAVPPRAASGRPVSGSTRVVARSDGCAAFTVTIGRCPGNDSEVLLPASAIGAGRAWIGAPVGIGPARPVPQFTVVGGYDPARSSALLLARTDPLVGAGQAAGPDLVLTTDGIARLPVAFAVSARTSMLPQRVRVDQEPALRAAVTTAQQATIAQAAALSFTSGLPDLLDRVDGERRAIAALVWVVTAQIVALAWFSAAVVTQLVARARTREWALGRLRGVPRPTWLRSVFAEPAAILLTGAVIGFGLGILICRLVTDW